MFLRDLQLDAEDKEQGVSVQSFNEAKRFLPVDGGGCESEQAFVSSEREVTLRWRTCLFTAGAEFLLHICLTIVIFQDGA